MFAAVVGWLDWDTFFVVFGQLTALTTLVMGYPAILWSFEEESLMGVPHVWIGIGTLGVVAVIAAVVLTSECFGTIFTEETEQCSAWGTLGVLSLWPMIGHVLLGVSALVGGIAELWGKDPFDLND